MTRNERAHAYVLAMLPEAAGNVEADVLVKHAFALADAFESVANQAETPLPKIEPQPDSDGWIAWGGGDMPVEDGATVFVRFRDGDELGPVAAGRIIPGQGRCAAGAFWECDDMDNDIIAYKVLP